MSNPMLKYRFHAVYADGTFFVQNEEDVSARDPARSAFYDVDQSRLEAFALAGEGHTYAVDLTDGTFAIDGVPFRMHEGPLSDLQLIFFRRHTHTISGQFKELAHQTVYRLGWQATNSAGRRVQRVMELD
jgi:hypothetical protein